MKRKNFQRFRPFSHETTFKQAMLLCGFVIVQMFCTTQANAQNYNVDNTEPYELVIPNLGVLHTNIIFSKEDQFTKTIFYKEDNGYVLIGDMVNSDTLIKYIETDILKDLEVTKLSDDQRYRDGNQPTIKSLKIYCDKFVLNKSLWFPEVTVLIHARNVEFENQSVLRTDPRPWRENKSASEGKNGLKAGNIEIITQAGSGDIVLEANGSDGTGVAFPTLSFIAPTVIEDFKIYRCYPPGESAHDKCNSEFSYQKSDGVVGIVFLNQDSECAAQGKGKGFINKDYFAYDPATDKLTDQIADQRLKWTPNNKYGNGGSGGNISVVSEKNTRYTCSASNGYHGAYYKSYQAPSDEIDFSCRTIGDYIIGDIKVGQKKDYYKVIKLDNYMSKSHWWPFCDDFDSRRGGDRIDIAFDKIDTRSGENSFREFDKQFKEYSYRPSGKDKLFKQGATQNFAPSVMYLRHKLILAKNSIKDYQSLSETNKKEIAESIRVVAEGLASLETNLGNSLKNAANEGEKKFYNLKLNEVKKLNEDLGLASKNLYGRYSDEFNNPLGYRPVLSFPAIGRILDGSINEDLELYLRTSDAMKNINNRDNFQKQIPTLIPRLDSVINRNYALLKENEQVIEELGKDGQSLAVEAEKLNKDLVKKQEDLLVLAKDKADKEKWVRIGGKVLAVAAACAATAAGGPAAGALTYSIVDKIGNAASDKFYSKADNVEAEQRNVNIVPLLDKFRENKLEAVQSELKKLEYRKSNGLFNNFKDWKVDSTNNYITTKLPESLEQYQTKKAELEGKIEKLNKKNENHNAMAAFTIKGAEEVWSIMGNTTYLNNAIDRVINNSQEYKAIGEKIKYNAYENGKFVTKMRNALLEKGEIITTIEDYGSQKYQLNAILANKEAYMDPLLKNNMSLIQNQSLERLKWMEYSLIKVYNYTTLSQYPSELTNYRSLFSNELKSAANVSSRITTMKTNYENTLKQIKSSIVSKATRGHKEDGGGARISINKPEAIQAINAEKYYTIDLYNDFNDVIIKPNRNNIRVISLELKEFQLSRPLTGDERVELEVTFDDKGVLRKDDKFYLFTDDENSTEKWEFTLGAPEKGSTEQAKLINSSQNSAIYKELLSYLIDNTGKANEYLFTLKPAWSKIKVSATMEDINTKNHPAIERLTFNVRTDYEDLSANLSQKVCDFRVGATDTDVRLIVSNKTKNTTDTLSHSQYNVLTNNTTFKAKAYSIDPSKVFSHWETQPKDLAKNNAQGDVLEFTVDVKNGRDVRVKPAFMDKPALYTSNVKKSSQPSLKYVHLYREPNLSSDAEITMPLSFFTKNITQKTPSVQGFYKVIYGFEEYFVNEKDLL